jgi:hypothetical protein
VLNLRLLRQNWFLQAFRQVVSQINLVRKLYQVRPVTLHFGRNAPKPGFCTYCGATATKQALFKQPGAVIIEKYCDACMEPKEFERLQAIYSRIG